MPIWLALLLAAVILAGLVWLALRRIQRDLDAWNTSEDPWNECSDLQGSPRTSARIGGELPVAEILQCHDGDNNR